MYNYNDNKTATTDGEVKNSFKKLTIMGTVRKKRFRNKTYSLFIYWATRSDEIFKSITNN